MKPKRDRAHRTGREEELGRAPTEASEILPLFPTEVLLKDSLTFRLIWGRGWLDGAIDEAKKVLRFLGEDAFGFPDIPTTTALEQLRDLARLEELLKRIRTAGSWQELLGQPGPGRKSRRRRSP